MITAVPFCPSEGTRLLDYAVTARRDFLDEIGHNAHATRAYAMGSLEGELAFALAVDPDSPYMTFSNCRQALLLRLGLAGEGLTLEQERLRGWIVGLLSTLSASFDAGE